MGALVFAGEGGIRCSSRTVATTFEKQHKDVLRAVDNLIEMEPDLRRRNFAPSSEIAPMPNGGTRQHRTYAMDRDGFSLLAMGFTGAAALRWKLRFLEAFNAMEAALRGGVPQPDLEPVRLTAMNNTVRTAVRLGGIEAGRSVWASLGLPVLPPVSGPSALSAPLGSFWREDDPEDPADLVHEWMKDRKRVTVQEVAEGVGIPDPDQRMRRRIGILLRDMGYAGKVVRRGDRCVKEYARPRAE